MRMRHVVICGLPRSANLFPYYLINGMIYGKKKLLNTKCVFWFPVQLLSEKFLILRRIERDMIINVHRSSCKVPVILVRLQWILNFLDRLSKKKNLKCQKFHENPSIRPVWAELFYADGQTDMTKLTVAFRNFAPNETHSYEVINTGYLRFSQRCCLWFMSPGMWPRVIGANGYRLAFSFRAEQRQKNILLHPESKALRPFEYSDTSHPTFQKTRNFKTLPLLVSECKR